MGFGESVQCKVFTCLALGEDGLPCSAKSPHHLFSCSHKQAAMFHALAVWIFRSRGRRHVLCEASVITFWITLWGLSSQVNIQEALAHFTILPRNTTSWVPSTVDRTSVTPREFLVKVVADSLGGGIKASNFWGGELKKDIMKMHEKLNEMDGKIEGRFALKMREMAKDTGAKKCKKLNEMDSKIKEMVRKNRVAGLSQ
ncbi:hypothetical protein ACLOJK_009781 [Asimina triloba]